jgi:pimeloyl-ACP methyl ester carboxylesterase
VRAAALVALLTGVTVLGGCTATTSGHGSTSALPSTPSTPSSASGSPSGGSTVPRPPIQPRANFSSCAAVLRVGVFTAALPADRKGKVQLGCATISVPLDYAHPDGSKISLQLVRVHYAGAHPLGSLLINPGGPGASGLIYALEFAADPEYSLTLLRDFDLVGFDPRGVQLSTPIVCLGTTAQRDRLNGLSPDVRTPQGFVQAKQTARAIALQCSAKYGADLAQFDTVNTARDLDQIREAVGDAKLSYLGFSYGTELGSVYAHLYPQNVRAAVLDGAVDPLTDPITALGNQMHGFEAAFDQFAAWCRTQRSCTSLGNPRQAVYRLVAIARSHPIPTSKSGDDRRATPNYVITGVGQALYSRSLWPTLASALTSAQRGDAAGLFALADEYNGRLPNGYSNILDANLAIGCNDTKPGPSDQTIRALAVDWARRYPMFGLASVASLFSCQQWQPVRTPPPLPTAPTPATVLVIGNTHDPATPFQGALDLARTMGHAEVLTWDGEGHTSYLQGNGCIDRDVEQYLVAVRLPPEHTTCPR